MATSGRNIERGEWKGREENEIQCDADVDLPRESPTPNWHCTRQSHHANGICNRGVKSTNDNRASEHLVPFVNSKLQLWYIPILISTFLASTPGVMGGLQDISPAIIDRASLVNESG